MLIARWVTAQKAMAAPKTAEATLPGRGAQNGRKDEQQPGRKHRFKGEAETKRSPVGQECHRPGADHGRRNERIEPFHRCL